ncbi:MAG: DUF2142 domain-containing protein [Lachnospiraceae bacterium]|nr:DUF2142 domain-containing protein [Lachnospiraceae bacterium]
MIEKIAEKIKETALAAVDALLDFQEGAEANCFPWPARCMIAMVICMTTAFLAECLIFQLPSVRYKSAPLSFYGENALVDIPGTFTVFCEKSLVELDEEEAKSIQVERNSRKILENYLGEEQEEKQDDTLVEKADGSFWRRVNVITFSVRLPKARYVKKLDLRLHDSLTGSCGYSVKSFLDTEKAMETTYCSIDPKTKAGIANLGCLTDQLEISIMTADDIQPSDVVFTLSNQFAPNGMRILWVFFVMLTVAVLIEFRYPITKKLEWCFALGAFIIGLLLILGIGTNQVSYDEHVHAKAAYKLSFGSRIETTESAMQMNGNQLPMFHNPEERALVEQYEDENHDYSWADIGFQSRFVRTEDRVYYPLAAGFWLGRMLHLSFAATVALAKMCNLLCYIVVCFFAIRLAKRYQELVCMVALLPNSIFLAASISYDMIVNSFLLLGCVLLYNEFLEPDEKVEWYRLLPMLMCFVIGSLSKPIYVIMVGMFLFLGKKKFRNPLQEWVCKISVLILIGLMLYNIFRPLPVAGSDYNMVGDFALAGDKRNVGASVTGQVQYILSNPVSYAMLLLSQMGSLLFSYVLGGKGFFQYGYVGESPMLATWGAGALAILLAILKPQPDPEERYQWEKGHVNLGAKNRALTILMCFGLTAVIWTSMYVSYTAVGADTIKGVQGRYFTPLFLPALLCFLGDKKSGNMGRCGRNRLAWGLMVFMNLSMIWRLIICVYNV